MMRTTVLTLILGCCLLFSRLTTSYRVGIIYRNDNTYLVDVAKYAAKLVDLQITTSTNITLKYIELLNSENFDEKLDKICTEITATESLDLIIDLTQDTLKTNDFCLGYFFVAQNDIPYLGFDMRKCNWKSSLTDGLSTAVLYPSLMGSVSAFSKYILRGIFSDIAIIYDDSISLDTGLVFPGTYHTPSVNYYQVPGVEAQLKDPGLLTRLITATRKEINSFVWLYFGNERNTSSLLNSLLYETKDFTPSYYRNWIIFDQSASLNFSQCLSVCLNKSGPDCTPPNTIDNFYCATFNGHDTNETLRMAIIGLTPTISNLDFNGKITALASYETVFSGLSVMKNLISQNKWTSSTPNACFGPDLTDTPRTNMFINGFSGLGKWTGPMRTINFTQNDWHKHNSVRLYSLPSNSKKMNDTKVYYDYPDKLMVNDSSMPMINGVPLKVLVIQEEPFSFVDSNGNFTGLFVELFEEIARQLNLTYEYSLVDKSDYEIFTESSNLTGIFQSISSMTGDIGIGPLMIDSGLTKYVDFTDSIMDSVGITMVTSKSKIKNSIFFFTTVFSASVWAISAVCLVITGFLMAFFDKMSPYSYQNRNIHSDGEPEGVVFTLKESMWFVIGAFTQLGECYDPRSNSTRFIICGFWIFTSIMTSMFNSNLSAFLTVDGLSNSFSTFNELIAQTDIKYTVEENSTSMKYFYTMMLIEKELFNLWTDFSYNKSTNFSTWSYPIDEHYATVWENMMRWGMTKNFKESSDQITSGNVIFMDSPTAQYRIAQNCFLRFGENMGSWEYGFVLTRNSPFTKIFNELILNMKNDLIVETLTNKWLNMDAKSCTEVDSSNGFTINEIGGIFVILAIGILMSFIIMLFEKLYVAVLRKKGRKVSSPPSTQAPPIDLGNEMRSTRRGSTAGLTPPHQLVLTPRK